MYSKYLDPNCECLDWDEVRRLRNELAPVLKAMNLDTKHYIGGYSRRPFGRYYEESESYRDLKPVDPREIMDVFFGDYTTSIDWIQEIFGVEFLEDPAAFFIACCWYYGEIETAYKLVREPCSSMEDLERTLPDAVASFRKNFQLPHPDEFFSRFGGLIDDAIMDSDDGNVSLLFMLHAGSGPNGYAADLAEGGTNLKERLMRATVRDYLQGFFDCLNTYFGVLENFDLRHFRKGLCLPVEACTEPLEPFRTMEDLNQEQQSANLTA